MLRIYGAGMAGLLTAKMLHQLDPVVYEAKGSLPNNHGALLRFRSDVVSQITGIPFRRVQVTKAVCWDEKLYQHEVPLGAQNAYSYKVAGVYTGRSIMNLAPGDRWIAPANFLDQLADGVRIQFNSPLTPEFLRLREPWTEHPLTEHPLTDNTFVLPIISTIPMPMLAKMVGWDQPINFQHWEIVTVRVLINAPYVDLYQTIYFPGSEHLPYRVSFTGNLMLIECLLPKDGTWKLTTSDYHVMAKQYLWWFGLSASAADYVVDAHRQQYGKLIPLADGLRRPFIMAMTDRYGIYSVGRFATWRQLLLDDVAKDVEVVGRLIRDRSQYTTRLHNARKGAIA